MIYLKIAHVDDNDCDLFSFQYLIQAVEYIYRNQISEYTLSDILSNEFSADDYTLIK